MSGPPLSPRPSLNGMRVLVVDDDRVALAVLSAIFLSAGAQVETINNGAEAVRRIQEAPPDFLLCDIYMAGMDGFEVIRRVRELPSPVGTLPAVAITAHPSFDNRRDALRAGFLDVLAKPTESVRLLELVLRLCREAT